MGIKRVGKSILLINILPRKNRGIVEVDLKTKVHLNLSLKVNLAVKKNLCSNLSYHKNLIIKLKQRRKCIIVTKVPKWDNMMNVIKHIALHISFNIKDFFVLPPIVEMDHKARKLTSVAKLKKTGNSAKIQMKALKHMNK